MKTLFLCGVAILGLALMPLPASAAALGSPGAARLLASSADRTLLVEVQHRPHRGSGHRGTGYHGGHRGGAYHGGRHDRGGGGGDAAGAVAAGAAIGLFFGAVMAAEAQRQQAVDSCMRRYRSYDPQSMTFVGRDGRRYRCP